jgi:hypothetical protein
MKGPIIRQLVSEALHQRRLTPRIEDEINYELTRLGAYFRCGL